MNSDEIPFASRGSGCERSSTHANHEYEYLTRNDNVDADLELHQAITNLIVTMLDVHGNLLLKGERLESVFEKPTIHLGFDILQATMWMEGVNRWKID